VPEQSNEMLPLLIGHDWGAAISWHAVIRAFGARSPHKEDTFSISDAPEDTFSDAWRDAQSQLPVVGFVSCCLPNPEAYAEAVNTSFWQIWAALYILFFNMYSCPATA